MNACASTCFLVQHGNALKTKCAMIFVEKSKEQLEITRNAATKIRGDLKVGAKVTVQYESRATETEVKAK